MNGHPFRWLRAGNIAIIGIATSSWASAVEFHSVFRDLAYEADFIPIDIDEDGDLDLLATTPRPFYASSSSTAVFYQEANGNFDGPYTFAYHSSNVSNHMLFGKRKITDPVSVYRLQNPTNPADTIAKWRRYHHTEKNQISIGEITPLIPSESSFITSADIDKDGYQDILINENESSISISWGNNSGSTLITNIDDQNDFSSSRHILDIDGNGHLDVVYKGTVANISGLCVVYQTSSRVFTAPQVLQTTTNEPVNSSSFENLADLNGDGKLDLYHIEFRNLPFRFTYSLQTASGFAANITTTHTFEPYFIVGVEDQPGEKAKIYYVAESEANELLELHTVIYDDPNTYIKHDLEVQLSTDAPLYKKGNYSPVATLYDINQDGHSDVLFPLPWKGAQISPYSSDYYSHPQLCVGFGQPDGTFQFSWQGNPPLIHSNRLSGDFDNDGYRDLIVGATPTGEFVLFKNTKGNGWLRLRELTELVPASYRNADVSIDSITSLDMNGDGITDLNVRLKRPKAIPSHGFTYYCSIALNRGDGTFYYPSAAPELFLSGVLNQDCKIFDYADWDNDGDLDAMAEGFGWYENTGASFSTSLNFIMSPGSGVDLLGNPISLRANAQVVDVDGDGSLDFVNFAVGYYNPYHILPDGTPSPQHPEIAVAYGNGDGGIDTIITYPIATVHRDALGNPTTFKATFYDVNLNGQKDLIYPKIVSDVLGNPYPVYHLLYNSGEGRLPSSNPINASNGFHSLNHVDFDGDGQIDLASASQYTSASQFGPISSPKFDFLSHYQPDTSYIVPDLDGDYDADALFKTRAYSEGLYSVKNPIVNGDDLVVRYALDAGLRGTETLPSADPENDGINNLTEFMLGGHPLAIDSSELLPQLGINLTLGTPRLTASFNKRKTLPDGRHYKIQISHDLFTWFSVPMSQGNTSSIDATWENIQFEIDPSTLLPDGKRAFIKWDVE